MDVILDAIRIATCFVLTGAVNDKRCYWPSKTTPKEDIHNNGCFVGFAFACGFHALSG